MLTVGLASDVDEFLDSIDSLSAHNSEFNIGLLDPVSLSYGKYSEFLYKKKV